MTWKEPRHTGIRHFETSPQGEFLGKAYTGDAFMDRDLSGTPKQSHQAHQTIWKDKTSLLLLRAEESQISLYVEIQSPCKRALYLIGRRI